MKRTLRLFTLYTVAISTGLLHCSEANRPLTRAMTAKYATEPSREDMLMQENNRLKKFRGQREQYLGTLKAQVHIELKGKSEGRQSHTVTATHSKDPKLKALEQENEQLRENIDNQEGVIRAYQSFMDAESKKQFSDTMDLIPYYWLGDMKPGDDPIFGPRKN